MASDTTLFTVRVRDHSFPDAGLAEARLGRLEVAIRSHDRPTQVLPEAIVLLERDGFARRLVAPSPLAVAAFDSLPVGDYRATVRRIGYNSLTMVVPVRAGCRTDLEAYLSVAMIGLFDEPVGRGHAVATVCAR